jgi:hypothetical protein
MPPKLIELPFLRGQDEGISQQLLNDVAPQGTLARAINVRLGRDGELVQRPDYETLPMTTPLGTLVATDVLDFDGRLVALGDAQGRGYPSDLYEFVDAAVGWVPTDQQGDLRLSPVTRMRDVGRLPSTGLDTTHYDVAATGGYVCLVYSDASASYVHVFEATGDKKLLVERSTSILFQPRVVAIAGVFYIAGISSSSVTLRSFDPLVDTTTQSVSTPFGAGDAIVAWDMTTNTAGTELIMAVARATPATEIRRVNTAGTTLQTITGPATLLDFCSVWNDGTRIHFIDVVDTTRIVRISTYLVSGGALENGPTTLFSSGTTLMQATLIQRSATIVRVVAQLDANNRTVAMQDVTVSTHALGSVDTTWRAANLTSKGLGVPALAGVSDALVASRFIDPDCTHCLVLLPQQPCGAKDHYTSAETQQQLPHLATDTSTGRVYWANAVRDVDGVATPLATEFALRSTARIQSASIGGHLYLATGALYTYDGRELAESGFLDQPQIISATPSNGAGSLTPSTVYTVTVTWERTDALGHLHTSAPAPVELVTMGGSDDTITIVATTPHSIRRNASNETFGGAVKVIAWSTTSNGTALQRAVVTTAGQPSLGDTVSLVILGPDATIAEQAVLYTQGARGALSGPLRFETALPSRYVWASKDRLLLGGQPYAPSIQESRPLFTSEPIQWSLGIGFFTAVRGPITAVAVLDEQRFVFTAREIFAVPGDGIDDTGRGTLGPAVKLPSECGCIDWRSMVEVGAGLMFQGANDKIYLMPRGGGAPAWIGQPVRDTLEAFPLITSATLVERDQTVCFTACNTALTDSRLLVYDLRAQAWYVDEPPAPLVLTSSCASDGVLAVTTAAGAVQRQIGTPAQFVSMLVESGDVHAAGPDGWAQYYAVTLLATYRGQCTVTMSYSLDGGTSYTVHPRVYEVSGLADGARVRRVWQLGQLQGESLRVRYEVTDLGGVASRGLGLHSHAVLAEAVAGVPRPPASDQG